MNMHNSRIPGCIRKMSHCERMFFTSPACTVMMAARVAGPLDTRRFRQALEEVSGIHPFLRVKIVFDDRHEAYFSSDDVPPVPLTIVPRQSERQWLEVLEDEARIPFPLDRGPLLRCTLLHAADVSDLLVVCNHSICDGMALAIFIRDLLDRYGDPGRDTPSRRPPDAMELLPPGVTLMGLIGRLVIARANRKWLANPYRFGPEEYADLYRAYWKNRRPGLVLFEFDLQESERLAGSCRDHGVSVGSAVTTACLFAHAEIAGGFPRARRHLMIPFDLRRRTDPPVGDVFSLCVGSLHLPFACSPKKTFWQNATALHEATRSRLSAKRLPGIEIPPFDPSLLDAVAGFSLLANRIPCSDFHTETLRHFRDDPNNAACSLTKDFEARIPGLVPTNLGRIEMGDNHGDLQIDRLVFIPTSSEINPLVLGGIGAGGRIVFSLPFVDPPARSGVSSEPELIRIRNRALEHLGFPEKVHAGAVE
jgi:hypothetical protein